MEVGHKVSSAEEDRSTIGASTLLTYLLIALLIIYVAGLIRFDPCWLVTHLGGESGDQKVCPASQQFVWLFSVPGIFLILAVWLARWRGLGYWSARATFLTLAALILFGLFAAPPLKLRDTTYSDNPTKVSNPTPLKNTDSASLTPAERLVSDEHKKAVDEIKMRIEQEDGWYRYKFVLIGGLLLAFIAHIAGWPSERSTERDLEGRMETLLRSNATCVVLALAAVVAFTIDLHIRSSIIVINQLGLWLRHYVEPALLQHKIEPPGFLPWESFLRVGRPATGFQLDELYQFVNLPHLHFLTFVIYVVYLGVLQTICLESLNRPRGSLVPHPRWSAVVGFVLVHVAMFAFVWAGHTAPSAFEFKPIPFVEWWTWGWTPPLLYLIPWALLVGTSVPYLLLLWPSPPKFRWRVIVLLMVVLGVGATVAVLASTSGDAQFRWLVERSMLHQAKRLALPYSGHSQQWLYSYATAQPRAAAKLAPVWFTAYPESVITRKGDTILRTLGDAVLWRAFGEIGINGIHTGPVKRAGGVRDLKYTPSVDGNFDRISMEIDPNFESEEEYKSLTRIARESAAAVVIGDIIPGHSGKGADFRLAERGYEDYPGLYHMVEIFEKDWGLLPPPGKDSVNLTKETVDQLKGMGYIVGRLQREPPIFAKAGIKETDWSATDVVTGVDGRRRRWVYLHYFKEGQPTFNWLDPSFAAQRLVLGDALHSLGTLGEKILRLDANGFLGIEVGSRLAWSEGHPLTLISNQIIAGLVRKLNGFTFQELNLTLADINDPTGGNRMSGGGADLSYDFVTRPAYHHALVTGDTEFLRLMLGLQREYKINPIGLIHALQNHDELTLELRHFATGRDKDRDFTFHGKKMKGSDLGDRVRNEMKAKLIGAAAPYNREAGNGVSCTTVTVATAALGITDISSLSDAQKGDIQRAHLLVAMYNAMQPGVFALSGWDLVGALTLPSESVEARLRDGDTRWINRGAYDLLGVNPAAKESHSGLPRAQAIYGPLPQQLNNPASFASQIRKMLRVRTEYRINESAQIDVPEVRAKGLLVMVHRLVEGKGIGVTALNFGQQPVAEAVGIKEAPAGAAIIDLLAEKAAGKLVGTQLRVSLGPHEGKVLLLHSAPAAEPSTAK